MQLENKKCLLCGVVFKRTCELSRHLKLNHNMLPLEYTLEYLLKNEIPLCECGCGKKVRYSIYKVNIYCVGHSGGGLWQLKFDKDSDDYKNICQKISNSLIEYKKDNPQIIHEHQRINNSNRMKNLYKNNPDELTRRIEKMKRTKKIQSELGILSERHWTKKLSESELDIKLAAIGKKISNTKQSNPRISAWNSGLSSESDDRILKWSGENHYRYNTNKKQHDSYGRKFKNKEFRKYILETQYNQCFWCNRCGKETIENQSLCLHHIDEDKTNNEFDNLIFVCRSCHIRIHNTIILKNKFNEDVIAFKNNIKEKNNNLIKNGVYGIY